MNMLMIEQYRVGEEHEAKRSRIFFSKIRFCNNLVLLLQPFSEIFLWSSEAELSKGWWGHAARTRNH